MLIDAELGMLTDVDNTLQYGIGSHVKLIWTFA